MTCLYLVTIELRNGKSTEEIVLANSVRDACRKAAELHEDAEKIEAETLH